jgi:hypothetical protein
VDLRRLLSFWIQTNSLDCQHNYSYIIPKTRLCRREITGKCAIKLWWSVHRPESNIERKVKILVSGLCTLYHNFYCIFFCYLPSTKPGLRYLYSCGYTDMGCPVMHVSSFSGTQQSRCLPLTWGRKQISFSQTFLFLEYRMKNEVRKPSNSECYTPSSEPFTIYLLLNLIRTGMNEPKVLHK